MVDGAHKERKRSDLMVKRETYLRRELGTGWGLGVDVNESQALIDWFIISSEIPMIMRKRACSRVRAKTVRWTGRLRVREEVTL